MCAQKDNSRTVLNGTMVQVLLSDESALLAQLSFRSVMDLAVLVVVLYI